MIEFQPLDPETFDQMIAESGRPVIWQRATRCSCWDPATRNPARGCKACGGRWGYLYDPEVPARLLITGINLTSQYAQFGVVEIGDSIVSVPTKAFDGDGNEQVFAMWEGVGQFDRIVLTDVTTRLHELLIRDELMTGGDIDPLRHPWALDALAVVQSNKETGAVVRFDEGTDYLLHSGGIQWLSHERPATGTQYSVLYTANPTFLVLSELPQPRGVDGAPLPKRLHVRYADRVMEGVMAR